ncbi:MAG: DNA-directed RNA polymerase subunit alpha C-terminal domain-containing protein [Mollicutes bacterium]|nr:MAG: DNA-directed RNA polymerase subunit alpha C-terminal domain-containing protein [Mollicutes bacterium]
MQGRGFANFEETKDLIKRLDQDTFGIIALSTNFSPVEQVSVKVEEIKVGERAVIEQLKLKIKSNGALDPVRCLVNATKIFTAHLAFFNSLEDKGVQDFAFQEKKPLEKIEFDTEIMHLDFSKRTDNALEMAGIKKLSQLRKLTRKQLSEMKNIGQKSLDEIETKLKKEYNIILED